MDVVASYPLTCAAAESSALVPVSANLVLEEQPDDSPPELLAFLLQVVRFLLGLFAAALLTLTVLRRQLGELRCQAHYWQAMHQRAVQREAELVAQVQQLRGELRELKRRHFGRKAETSSTTEPARPNNTNTDKPARKRGQQPGNQGPGRRNHEHLPTTEESCALPEADQSCRQCGQPLEEIPGTADGDILEIEVRAHRRRYHRKRYRCRCGCRNQPGVVTAPPPDKLIPKSNLGLSVWTLILQRKFQFFQPLHRVLAELRGHGLDLAAGTITDGLQKLVPLFTPLYRHLVDYNRAADHWHADETRWPVFEKRADKAGFTWMLWVFAAKDSVVFVLDPTRAHEVPEGHFGDDAAGILNVDRYSAYKAMAQVKAGDLVLAFCWAHVRRDFLAVFTGWPELHDWAWSWLDDIGTLYQRNAERLALAAGSVQQANAELALRAQVEQMQQRCTSELAEPKLRLPQRKVLTSLHEHWAGLTVFVDHPEVPLDNNRAERCQRGPVVARKNFYGSGAAWSGRLAAMLFSLFQTLPLWGLDVGRWLSTYLTACAQAGGQPPPDPQRYLPWNLSAEERDRLRPPTAQPPTPAPAPSPPPPSHP